MMKDPLHTEETPYELLGLNPDASHNEVHLALPRFLQNKDNLSKRVRAQESAKKLRNPRDRIAFDILYYCIEKIDENDCKDMDIYSSLSEFVVVPYFSDDELYLDLKKEDFSREFKEMKSRKIEMKEITKFNNIESIRLEINFDK